MTSNVNTPEEPDKAAEAAKPKEPAAPAMKKPSQPQPRKEPATAQGEQRSSSEREPATQPSQAEDRLPLRPAPKPDPGNGWLVDELQATLKAGKAEVATLRRRLRITYGILILMSIGMFLFAMAMVGFPARAFFDGEIDELSFSILGGFGALVLALLLYFRPLERLQALIADSTYVALVKESFQYQVTLRLLAVDTDDPESVSKAASYVGQAAQASMDLVYTQMQARRAAGFTGPVGG